MSETPTDERYRSIDDIPKQGHDTTNGKKPSDAEIASAVAEDPDAAPIADETFWQNASVVMPEGKEKVTIRLDKEVLRWFKAQGKGYQSRINAVLRSYVSAQTK